MKNFLRENWLYIAVPLAILAIVITMLVVSGELDNGTRYTIQ